MRPLLAVLPSSVDNCSHFERVCGFTDLLKDIGGIGLMAFYMETPTENELEALEKIERYADNVIAKGCKVATAVKARRRQLHRF